MSPIQQMLLGAGGAVATKTYIDDIFSTFLYTGNDTYPKNIVNGIDLAGEGGAVFGKPRTGAYNWTVHSTEQGVQKGLAFNGTNAQYDNTGNQGGSTTRDLTNFNNNGFTLGTGWSASGINPSGIDVVTYTLRKCSGFFDVVTYTGNGTAGRTVSHNLGSVPGFIAIKCTSDVDHWCCYHKSRGGTKFLALNLSDVESTNSNGFNDTTPTSTEVTLGISGRCNGNGKTYVMYLFAGGESTAATARSVDFDGDDYFDTATSSDLDIGTGDFTIEFWVNFDDVNSSLECILETRSGGGATSDGIMLARWHTSTHENKVSVYMNGFLCEEKGSTPNGQWNHFAVVRSSGTTSLYKNGTFEDSFSDSNNWSNTSWNIGCLANDTATKSNAMHGSISNFRFVKGTAVYTSSFRPTYEPLTNITNTKLLCCQSSTVTASTGVTLSANGNPTASTDSPFDDPAGFAFGENEDQNLIKCGSYVGNGNADGPEINLGWEPQWILIKNTTTAKPWCINDMMRGFWSNGTSDDITLFPNLNNAELAFGVGEFTSTGFKLRTSDTNWNNNNDTYIFIAIRRPDGYCGKPPELGTGVFAMDTGNGSSTIPTFDSGFPVDFALTKITSSTGNWTANGRLIGTKFVRPNTTGSQSNYNGFVFDSNVGYGAASLWGSSYQAWMWKRYAGFDFVTWQGNDTNASRSHNLGKTPEMIWFKNKDDTRSWRVYHKGLNGGTNPEDYAVSLNSTSAEGSNTSYMNGTAPTSTHFVAGLDGDTNVTGDSYIAMLFASTDVSKVGFWVGNNTNNRQITTGFQPRFLIVFLSNQGGGYDWQMLDSTRGFISPNSNILKLNSTAAQSNQSTYFTPTSTGFTITESSFNGSGQNWIYYAHA